MIVRIGLECDLIRSWPGLSVVTPVNFVLFDCNNFLCFGYVNLSLRFLIKLRVINRGKAYGFMGSCFTFFIFWKPNAFFIWKYA